VRAKGLGTLKKSLDLKSAGMLLSNYDATNMAPTQKDEPFLLSKRRRHFKTHERSWNKHDLGHQKTTMEARTSSKLVDWIGVKPRVNYQAATNEDIEDLVFAALVF
jgi:hypothetical protein